MNNIFAPKNLFFVIVIIYVTFPQISTAQHTKVISEILDNHGKIKSGVDGSFDASGYTLEYGDNNEPVLKKKPSFQKSSTVPWSTLGTGINSNVYAIAVSGGDVYVGGDFTTAGGISVNNIAKWDGTSWSALGSGIGGTGWVVVYAITAIGGHVYVGGRFTTAGGISAKRIAKWNGSSWSALGNGIGGTNDYVRSIVVSGGIIFAGGGFVTAGGVSASRIAQFDGANWSALGLGVAGDVNAIAVNGSDIYAGGEFVEAGGIVANHIAKWNGSAWSALGSGVNNTVYAITVASGSVFVGGNFTEAGGNTANGIALWAGSWSTMGSGIDGTVLNIVVNGTDVYAGGSFYTAGGNGAKNIAKWSGGGWSFGSGPNNAVYALARYLSQNVLLVGGEFSMIDDMFIKGIVNFDFAQELLPVEFTSFTVAANQKTAELHWNTATETNNYGFEVERRSHPEQANSVSASKDASTPSPKNGSVAQHDWTRLGFVEGNGTTNAPKEYIFSDKNLSTGKYSYRLKQIDRDGRFEYSQTVEVEFGSLPNEFALLQNYPNPFNPTTVIGYQIPMRSNVSLKVYDAIGREVAILVNEAKVAGNYSTTFNASQYSSGVYFAILSSAGKSLTKKLVLMK